VQTLPSVLPPAEIGTALQEIPVTKRIYFLAVAAFLCTAAGFVQLGINQLDTATAHQCKTHDWPADKHAIHMDFCTTYGYPTN
jgi:hypothetical protein